ncbi:hypothetical protein GCM10020000_34230 [Streptomyces olivoverticillatus]
MMKVRTYETEGEVPAELCVQAEELREQAWPGLAGPHDPALRPVPMLLVTPEGVVTAALEILTKDIVHRGRTYRASGLSAVATDEAHRGRGARAAARGRRPYGNRRTRCGSGAVHLRSRAARLL